MLHFIACVINLEIRNKVILDFTCNHLTLSLISIFVTGSRHLEADKYLLDIGKKAKHLDELTDGMQKLFQYTVN